MSGFFPLGKFGIFVGLIWIGLAIWSFIYTAPILSEVKNMQDNGFHYLGETQLTISQYDTIKEYNKGKDIGEIVITSPESLIVKYDFLSLQKYDFLETGVMPDKSTMLAFAPIIPILMGVIGFMQIISSINSLKNKTTPIKEGSK